MLKVYVAYTRYMLNLTYYKFNSYFIVIVTALARTRDARDLILAMAATTVYIAPESSSLSSLALDSCI
jgi:hypothetical protein